MMMKMVLWNCLNILVMLIMLSLSVSLSSGIKKDHEGEKDDHNSVLCRSCGRELADPSFLRVSPLSPHFLERQNVSMFGSSLIVPVEKLRNPAGYEFSVITFRKG